MTKNDLAKGDVTVMILHRTFFYSQKGKIYTYFLSKYKRMLTSGHNTEVN